MGPGAKVVRWEDEGCSQVEKMLSSIENTVQRARGNCRLPRLCTWACWERPQTQIPEVILEGFRGQTSLGNPVPIS